MLGHKIRTPFHGILKFLARGLKLFYSLGVGHNCEIVACHGGKLFNKPVFKMLIEEFKLLGAFFKHGVYYVLYKRLGNFYNIGQLRKGNLGLNVPKLRNVARGVALFGAEGRAEGINFTERHCGNLAL